MKFKFIFDASQVRYSTKLLVELLKERNEDAFDYFTEYYFHKIYSYVKSRVYQEEEAIDISFDACRRIFEKIDIFEYRSDKQFDAWIYKNIKTVIYMYYRKKSIDDFNKNSIILDNNYVNTYPDPSTLKLDKYFEMLQYCLDQRELNVVIKHIFEAKSFKSIGEEIGCKTSAVSNCFYRSMDKCRNYLKNNKV